MDWDRVCVCAAAGLFIFSSEILVGVFRALLPLKVLFFDEDVDALLDHGHLGLEPCRQLIENLEKAN